MFCVLFDEVLDVSPSDTLWTVTGRSKSVFKITELSAMFPLDGVVLIFACRSTAKIERILFRREINLQCYMGRCRGISPFASSFRRCWMIARMGATPVPGPIQIIGVVGSSGRVTNPLEIPIKMVSPFDGSIKHQHDTSETETYLGPGSTSKTCILLSAGLSGESCSLPWQRRGVPPSDGSDILLSSRTGKGQTNVYTFAELAIENSRGLSGGNTSKM